MKNIEIPQDWSQISVKQWMNAMQNRDDKYKLIASVSNYTSDELKNVSQLALENAHKAVVKLLDQRPTRIHREFKLEGTTFAFIPDWSEFTAGEYADAEFFASEITKTAHEFLSVMYRPYARKTPWEKKLEPYTKPIYAEAMLEIPAEILGGAFLFFCLIDETYRKSTQVFLAEEVVQARSGQNTAGTTPSLSWRERMLQRLNWWRSGQSKEH